MSLPPESVLPRPAAAPDARAAEGRGATPPARPRRRWLRLVAVNLAVLAVLDVLVGSLLNRVLFASEPDEIWFERSDELGFRPRASVSMTVPFKPFPGGEFTITQSSQGFRNDRVFALPKPEGTLRIAVVGDSHTAGITENRSTYPGQLERVLSADGPVEVINAGVNRYSPYQSYLRLKSDVLPFDPDIVLAAIYVGNDLLDLLRFDDRPYLTIEDGDVVAHPPRFVVYADPPLRLWAEHSFLHGLYRGAFGYAVDRGLMLKDLVDSFGGGWGDAIELAGLLGSTGDREIISQTLGQAVYFDRYPKAQERAFALLRHVVNLYQELARREGHDLRFLLIPTRVHAEPRFDRYRINLAYEAVGFPPDVRERDAALYERARALLAEEGAHVIDPLAAMQEAARTGHALYWYEFHLNNWGGEVVARVIADDLRRAR